MQQRLATLVCGGVLAAIGMLAAGCSGDKPATSRKAAARPVVIYAARDEQLIRPVLGAYTEETGVPVRLITESGRALTDRLAAEKHRSTADLLLSDGIVHLWAAAEEDILRPTRSALLEAITPDHLQDPEHLWFALLVYGRAIAYDSRAVNPSELTGYAGLGDDRWQGKLCLSSSSRPDNQALIAMLIAEHGERRAELIVRAWIANLAMPVFADDVELLQAIENGQCGLGIANTDHIARLQRDRRDTPVALFWPPASSGGAYANIVGAAVTRHASNPIAAGELLEWLSSDKGQTMLAGGNLEYPVNRDVPAGPISQMRIAEAGYYHEDAVKLAERARYASSH